MSKEKSTISPQKEEGEKPSLNPDFHNLIIKISDAEKALMDLYSLLPPEEKHLKKYWRPLEKGIYLLLMNFQKTFFIKEIVKQREQQEIQRINQQIEVQKKSKD